MEIEGGVIMNMALAKDAEIRFRTSKSVKSKASEVYSRWGLNLGDAINAFLVKSIDAGGMPFEMRDERLNADTLEAIHEVELLKKDKNKKTYSSFAEALNDIDFDEV